MPPLLRNLAACGHAIVCVCDGVDKWLQTFNEHRRNRAKWQHDNKYCVKLNGEWQTIEHKYTQIG